MAMRRTQIGITLGALLLTAAHIWVPAITLDVIALTLVGVAVLPWLWPLFKSVELPGGLKVEFQDLERARIKVEESGLVRPSSHLRPVQRHRYSFQAVAEDDTNLALAGLRIEIESRLKDIAKHRNVEYSGEGVGALTRSLEQAGALSHAEAAAVRNLIPLLNRAAHGADVDSAAYGWAMDFGPQILGALENRIGESTIPRLVEAWRGRDGAAVVEIGSELSRAFVSSPNAFLAAMNEQPTVFREWLEGLEHHTFTIFEAKDELDNELYSAYYQRLKQLMHEAAISCKSGVYSAEAEAIEAALGDVKLKLIW